MIWTGAPRGAPVSVLSSSASTARAAAFDMPRCTSARCDSTAAFGAPVVPLVNSMSAGSSSASSTAGGAVVVPHVVSLRSCANDVTRSTPASRRRAKRVSSAKIAFGVVNPTPCASSDAAHQRFRPTAMPPRTIVAHAPKTYARWLAPANATRSPRPIPCCSLNTVATAATRHSISEKVTVSSGKRRNGRSPKRCAPSVKTALRCGSRRANTSVADPRTSSTTSS
jgi:hypothetical protein